MNSSLRLVCTTVAMVLAMTSVRAQSPGVTTEPAPGATLAHFAERDKALGDFKAKYRYTGTSYGQLMPRDSRTSANFSGYLTVTRRGRYVRVQCDVTLSRVGDDGKMSTFSDRATHLYRDGVLVAYPGALYRVENGQAVSGHWVDALPPFDTDLGYDPQGRHLGTPEQSLKAEAHYSIPVATQDALSSIKVRREGAASGPWGVAEYGVKRTFFEGSREEKMKTFGWNVQLSNGQSVFVPGSGFEIHERKDGFASRFTSWMTFDTGGMRTLLGSNATAVEAAGILSKDESRTLRRSEFELVELGPLPADEKVTAMESLEDINELQLDSASAEYIPAFTYDRERRECVFTVRYDEESGKWITLPEPLRVPSKDLASVPAGLPGSFRQIREDLR